MIFQETYYAKGLGKVYEKMIIINIGVDKDVIEVTKTNGFFIERGKGVWRKFS